MTGKDFRQNRRFRSQVSDPGSAGRLSQEMTRRHEKSVDRLSESARGDVIEMEDAMKTKTTTICDWCGKPRRDVCPFGDETVACFLCRTEATRHRIFDEKLNRYVRKEDL